MELDSILADALAAYRATRTPAKAPRKPKPQLEPPREPSTLFTAAANWQRARLVALVHAPSATVLGTFAEYLHVSEAGARRLVREDGTPVATEYTDWMPTAIEAPAPVESWDTHRTCFVPLTLAGLGGAHCVIAEIIVHLSHNFIASIALACETEFFAAAERITLPAGANILPVLDRDSKAAIFTEVNNHETQ